MKRALDFVRRKGGFDDGSDEQLTWNCLVHNKSFKLERTAELDIIIGFKEVFRVLKRLLSKSSPLQQLSDQKNVLLFYEHGKKEQTLDYIVKSSGEKIGCIYDRSRAKGNPYDFVESVQFLIFILSVALKCSLIKKNRANRALMIRDVYEVDLSIYLIAKQQVERVFDFLPYEKDANLLSYFLRKNGMKVVFIPSLNPLRDHNHTMIADEIVLVTPYQIEEMERLFRSTIRCNKIHRWIPEAGFTYISKYKNISQPKPKFALGFYSHGSWARNKAKHLGSDVSLKLEEWVLENIAQLMKENENLSLLVFLHPKEKKSNRQEVLNYYHSILGDRFEVADYDQRSVDQFHLVELGLASYSSIVYERLFSGFKMLVGSYQNDGFPMENSSLSKVYFSSREQMKQMVYDNLNLSSNDFFNQNNLWGYHYSSYQISQ
jgi:hypothetical protein